MIIFEYTPDIRRNIRMSCNRLVCGDIRFVEIVKEFSDFNLDYAPGYDDYIHRTNIRDRVFG